MASKGSGGLIIFVLIIIIVGLYYFTDITKDFIHMGIDITKKVLGKVIGEVLKWVE